MSRVEARMVFSVLKWTLFCFCRVILLVRGHFLCGREGEEESLRSATVSDTWHAVVRGRRSGEMTFLFVL
ncbi:hypothetical protein EYF80_010305 [Liparis tanakae]|uniref:Uncharacterized protein n=1 Tax=Liparis tanakae TaxID=230148 RepID=A0A4Z2INU0_9TELE|nr:hypothetical protein EYF80_010305 [Liparis tanakae]